MKTHNSLLLSAWVIRLGLTFTILSGAITAPAQSFSTLKTFSGSGSSVGIEGGLTLSDGMLYGVGGTIYKVSTNGSGFAVIHQFTVGSEGLFPVGRVAVSGNTIYGVTTQGGTNLNNFRGGDGIIYRMDTNGSNFSVLRRLDGTTGDGYQPTFGMVLSGSTLYGTTSGGGTFDSGTVFKINTNGTGYQNIHSFAAATEGSQPQSELTLIGNTLFGTTPFGSYAAPNGGMLFKLGLDGSGFAVLYTFTNLFSVFSETVNALTPVSNTLYGVGYDYNASKSSVYKINTNGSGFQIVSQLPSDSTFSGVLTWTGTELSGAWYKSDSSGGILQIKTNGTGYRMLKDFGTNSSSRVVDLLWTGSTIYGNAFNTANNDGAVFSLDVRPKLTSVATGSNVKISWPRYAQDYQLEQSPTLITSSWTNVITAPFDDGTNLMVTLPAPAASATMFHRLHRP